MRINIIDKNSLRVDTVVNCHLLQDTLPDKVLYSTDCKVQLPEMSVLYRGVPNALAGCYIINIPINSYRFLNTLC